MHVHILGICGTFMAGLAVMARQRGIDVSGSDANVYPPMSTQLAQAGIELKQGFVAGHLQPAPDLVVVGNAMTRGNPAIEYLLDSQISYVSGPEWLAREILQDRWVLAVAGTHGKTSTSAMLAWILDWAGMEPGFLIGGVPGNFEQSARLGSAPFFVVEADEYDSAFFDKRSKFIHYRPRTVTLNNLEFDHADIFPDLAAIQRQFHHLVRTIPANGLIVSNGADANLEATLAQGCWTPIERVSGADWQAEKLSSDCTEFALTYRNRPAGQVRWSQFGEHNMQNALTAIAAARHAGVPVEQACKALAQFKGVKRRLEWRGEVAGVTVYEDFAHHPTAIAATLAALRARAGGNGRVVALLELRSSTMRRGVFEQALPAALQPADGAVVYLDPDLEIDPATQHGVDLYRDIDAAVASVLRQVGPGDHLVIMSNGGFRGVYEQLLDALAALDKLA